MVIDMEKVKIEDDDGIKIKEGDIIQFTWIENSCWGKKGKYKGYVRIADGEYELVYIDRKDSSYSKYAEKTGIDELKSLLWWSEDIKIIGQQ